MQTQLVEKTTEEMNEDGMEFFLHDGFLPILFSVF